MLPDVVEQVFIPGDRQDKAAQREGCLPVSLPGLLLPFTQGGVGTLKGDRLQMSRIPN